MTSYLNTINSVGEELRLNNTSTNAVVIGYGLTSTSQTNTLGTTTIGAITGTSATFSSTLTNTGLITANGGLTSTLGATNLGTTTINNGSITTTLGVTGLASFGGGITSTAGATTLGSTTIGAITGTSASFSSGLTANGGLTSTAGATTLGASTIGAITGTSASFSSTLGVTGTSTLGVINVSGTATFTGGLVNTTASTTFSATTVSTLNTGVITSTVTTGTSPFVLSSTTVVPNLNASLLNGATFSSPGAIGSTTPGSAVFSQLTSTSGTTSLGTTNLTGDINMQSNKVINLPTPTNTGDAVPKGYVDNLVQGLDVKGSVRVATTTQLTLISSFRNGDTVDGIVLVTGDRILIKNQTDGIENGIYTVNPTGAPSRAFDYLSGSNVGGSFMFVENGTINSDRGFVCTNNNLSDIVGTNILIFTQFSGAGNIQAGTGLTFTGEVLDVDASQSQITQVGTLTNVSVQDTLNLLGSTSGIIGVKAQATAGTYTISLPSSAPANGNTLISDGSGILSWQTSGTLSSISLAVPSFLNVTGSPLTSNGTITIGLSGTALPVANGGTGSTSFTSTGVLLGNGSSSITTDTDFYYASDILYTPGISLSTIVSSGSVSLNSVTDSSSETSGGNLTVLGGGAIAKKLYVGTELIVGTASGASGITSSKILQLRGTTSGTISIKPQAVAGTYDFNLPSTLGSTGQMLVSGGVGNPMSWITPSISSAPQSFTANGLDDNTTQNVSGLIYSNIDTTQFNIMMKVDIANVSQVFELNGVYVNGGWVLSSNSVVGTGTGITFSILSGGQVRYTSTLNTGNNIVFTWTRFSTTQGLTYLALTGAANGVVTITPPAGSFTNYSFNLPTNTGSNGQYLMSTGVGSPASWVTLSQNSAEPETFTSSGVQSQVTPQNVPTLVYTSGSFDINMTVSIIATTSLTQLFKLQGIYSSTSGWSITPISISGDDTLVDFTISAGGNVQYTSSTYPGFVSLTFSWARYSITQGTSYLALTGGGVVTITPPTSGFTNYNYNLPTTSGTSGQVLTSGGGGSTPNSWVSVTGSGNVVLATTPTLVSPNIQLSSRSLGGAIGIENILINGISNVSNINNIYLGYDSNTGNYARIVYAYDGNNSSNNSISITCGLTEVFIQNSGWGLYGPGFFTEDVELIAGTFTISASTGNNLIVLSTSSSNSTVTGNSISTLGGIGVSGNSIFSSSTASSSTGTGALVVTGGVGIGGALFGTSLSMSNQITSTLASGTAPFVVASTTNVANLNASTLSGATFASPGAIGSTTPSTGAFTTLTSSGITIITNSTASLSTGTGALVVTGGVGIGGALFGTTMSMSGLLSANSGLTVTGANTSVTTLSTSGLLSANSGITVTGANTSVTTLSSSGLLSANLGLTVAGANTSVTTLSSSGLLSANLGLTVTGANTSVTTLTSSSTTASTTNSAGAVVLAGGLSISNTTEATSSTVGGTITTAGGLAVAKKAYIGGDIAMGANLTTIAGKGLLYQSGSVVGFAINSANHNYNQIGTGNIFLNNINYTAKNSTNTLLITVSVTVERRGGTNSNYLDVFLRKGSVDNSTVVTGLCFSYNTGARHCISTQHSIVPGNTVATNYDIRVNFANSGGNVDFNIQQFSLTILELVT